MIDIATSPELGRPFQLGFVVEDLEKAMKFWADTMGVGPFVLIENGFLDDRVFVHKGANSDIKMSLAFAYQGDTQIELIQQTNATPSPYIDFLQEGREGLHHIAYAPPDFHKSRRALMANGYTETTAILMKDGTTSVSYLTGPDHIGLMVELIPMNADREKYYAGIRNLSIGWNGERPVRRYATRADYMASSDCRV